MNILEVLNHRGSTQIEDVLADADIACASTHASADVSETMFDADAFAQPGAARAGGLKNSKLLL